MRELRGIIPALLTPFTADNGINLDALRALIGMNIKKGVSAFYVGGSTAEAFLLTSDERKMLLETVVDEVAGRCGVIAHIGAISQDTAEDLARHARDNGADAVSSLPPFYYHFSFEEIKAYYFGIADAIDIPVILYNIPGRTGIGITAETYKILSQHPNINGTKEASGDFSLFSRTRALCGDDLFFWSGNDDNTIPMMSMGALGVISVASNIIPQVVSDICRFCLNGDLKAATALYFKYADLFEKLFLEVNPIPIKTAMNLLGMDVGNLRLPLCEMAPENLEKLKKSLVSAGLELK